MLKRIIALMMACCILVSGTVVFAAEDAVQTYYLTEGTIKITRSTSSVNVRIYTETVETVSSIYHDVSIYVNGVKYTAGSGRYSDTYDNYLSTTINVPLSSRDFIDVYAEHYASHNGITESVSSNVSYTY